MSDIAAADFFAAFHLRAACCRALLELSQRQSELISGDDYAELSQVLHSKQSLLEHLGKLSVEQASLRNAWSNQRTILPVADRQRCDAVLSETERLLATLLSVEQTSTALLTSRRDATQRELQGLSAGRQTRQAYQPGLPAAVSRFDLNT